MESKEATIASFQQELDSILHYWATCTVDTVHGGFFGRLTNNNTVIPDAVKGSVLNARILWSFSAAYNSTRNDLYLQLAKRAFLYIRDHFVDPGSGGVYWSVTADGSPLDTKKQIYALAFAIYGLTEYYRATEDQEALTLAKSLFRDIETHSFDGPRGGYIEALTRDWGLIADLRLSDRDANEKKTMNTHLHILEAYTNLYRLWPVEELAQKIRHLIEVFTTHIVDPLTRHLVLFFDEDWQVRSDLVSYGHDIEASWLLTEAAEAIHDPSLLRSVRELAIQIADASAEGLAADGSMNYEWERGKDHLIAEKHWWVQAEAIIGFLNAWQLTGDGRYYEKFMAAWDYTRKYIVDREKGEWFWGRRPDGSVMEEEDKAGFWKCPYHNSRACIEVVRRLQSV